MFSESSIYAILAVFPLGGALIGWISARLINRIIEDEEGSDNPEYSASEFEFYPPDNDVNPVDLPDEEVLEVIHEEAKEQLILHLEEIDNVGSKATELIKLNLTIILITIAIIRLGTPRIDMSIYNTASWPIYAGLFYFTCGCLYLFYRRTSNETIGGIGESDIQKILDGPFNKPFFHEWVLKTGYENWIPNAREVGEDQHWIVDKIYFVTVVGIILTATGIILAAFNG